MLRNLPPDARIEIYDLRGRTLGYEQMLKGVNTVVRLDEAVAASGVLLVRVVGDGWSGVWKVGQ